MNLRLKSVHKYYDFCEEVGKSYKSTASSVLLFPHLQQASLEVASHLASTFSHKMSIGVIQGTGLLSHEIILHFSKLGYHVQTFSIEKESSRNELNEWVKNLRKDTLFLFYEEDQFFTGEKFLALKNIESESEKKIFTIKVSHQIHFYENDEEIDELTIRLLSLQNNKVLGLLGQKMKVQPLTSPYVLSNLKVSDFSYKKKKEEAIKIKEVESKLPDSFQSYFGPEFNERTFDRLVIYASNIDGDALLNRLAEQLSHSLEPVGEDIYMETASLCRWDWLKNFDWLGPKRIGENQLKGLLVLQKSILEGEKNIQKKLQQAYESVITS